MKRMFEQVDRMFGEMIPLSRNMFTTVDSATGEEVVVRSWAFEGVNYGTYKWVTGYNATDIVHFSHNVCLPVYSDSHKMTFVFHFHVDPRRAVNTQYEGATFVELRIKYCNAPGFAIGLFVVNEAENWFAPIDARAIDPAPIDGLYTSLDDAIRIGIRSAYTYTPAARSDLSLAAECGGLHDTAGLGLTVANNLYRSWQEYYMTLPPQSVS